MSIARESQPAEAHLLRCVESALVETEGDLHAHVTALEATGKDGRTRRWTLVEVVAAIREGAVFVTGGSQSGQAAVEPAVCSSCPRLTLVTHPATALADLPGCG